MSAGDAGGEQAPVSIDEDMPLQPHEFLAAVVSPHPSCLTRLDRLAVDDGGARGRFAPLLLAVEHHEQMVDPLEKAGIPPCVEVALDSAVRGKTSGKARH